MCYLIAACTENPFSDEPEIISKNSIRGTVQLENSEQPNGVYIWLEGINTGTLSDGNGEYLLTLPSRSDQPGGGITGSFNLYYYIANYEIQTTKLIIRNGEFLYASGDIDEKGNIQETKKLLQLASVHTEINPEIIPTSFDSTLRIATTVEVLVDKLEFRESGPDSQFIMFFLIEKLENDDSRFPLSLMPVEASPKAQVFENGLHQSHSEIKISPNFFSEGDYILIPFLWISQDALSPELVKSLGADFQKFNNQYNRIPFKRSGGQITVIAQKDSIGRRGF